MLGLDGEFDDGEGNINYVHMMEYICQYCDYEEGFFLEGDSCYKCAEAMENCVKCKSGDYCTDCGQDQFLAWDGQCQDNCYMYGLEYFLDSEFVCHKCSEEIEGCLKCVNEHECVECDVSRNLYLKDGVCQVCDTDAGFFINNGKCEICDDYVEGCLNCLDDYYCIECDIQHGYTLQDGECVNCDDQYGTIFFNYQCLECGKFEALEGCLDCSDYQTCTQCDLSEGYILKNNGKCEKCPIENGYFIRYNRCLKCDDYMSGCTLCQNSYSCQQCDVENNYYLYYNYFVALLWKIVVTAKMNIIVHNMR
ncbi:Insulin-like growth factor binding protein, N-terminal [Pseudocohnilembus persalinus]|uniref:Insulin-like growth factor binding protein, N-terminal n=1 Tax=Pseudocohnilembus persalinus TaxID=266149 RepID=A0A0V0Q8J7_PSEPJ|nr:Insulin-like growth factor binding protein, N-terminal [Pseudocohnilembus persalinus]|eukprot:KRW98553.1 Insulin-like growth factor binding protein, N-terminal [Pseudocohnilembus persalinus]